MNIINSDLLTSICQFNEIIDIFHYACSNIENMESIQSYLKRQIKNKMKYVNAYFPPFIVDTMNGIHTMVFAPILKFKPHFEGGTGYIDGIIPNDVDYPIMIGKDDFGRSFITFKLKLTENNKIHVETLFQRYSMCSIKWTWGTAFQSYLSNFTGYFSMNTLSNKYSSHSTKQIIINDILLKENIKLLLEKKNYIKKRTLYSDGCDYVTNELDRTIDIKLVYNT